ncbi:hypothetical protein [Syntrophomonas palmitatica]|uniref:hypothetical protein n=1 Tax=Syntrophomonas palmitatica TaxID=402877 RepID=UPI0006D166B8|nr:hypothetical protein [Syntrophomonas palmitatica]
MKGCRIKKGGVFLLMLAVLVISRSLFLDSDIPLPAVTEYCAIDEMYYNHAAFNLYHYGEYAHRVVPYVNDVGVNNNILENLLTFFTLATWGNTYYGLRMASVAASALIFAMLWYVLAGGRKKRETMPSQPEHGETVGGDAALAAAAGEEPGTASRCPRSRLPLSLWMLMLIGYLLVDFPFLVAGRVAEPTIFRILALAVLLCLLAAAERRGRLGSPCTSFFLGLLSLGCVLFVYLYNAFVFAAAAASVVAWHWRKGGRVVLRHLAFLPPEPAWPFLAMRLSCLWF